MKIIQKIILLSVIVFGLSSCASYRSKSYDYIYINKQGIIQKPVVAELNVKPDKAQLSQTYVNMTVTEAKESAMVDLIKANNCDLLVHPMFSIEANGKIMFSDKWTSIKIDLSGYPATYKNMKTFEAVDSTSFLVNAQINNAANKPMESVKENKPKTGKIIWGSVIALGLLLLIL
jgi:translation initiation factor 6 (eIF-6)